MPQNQITAPPTGLVFPTIILVRPQEEGNIGSVARAMANMGFDQLILVEPAPMLGGTARGFGVGGWQILESCQRSPSLQAAIGDFQRVIGTSSGRDRPFRQIPWVEARGLPPLLAADPRGTRTAVVFGPEDSGLSRAELELCHVVATIPGHADRPTLNLAQAVLIFAYEIFLASGSPRLDSSADREAPAKSSEVAALVDRGDDLLHQIGFDQDTIRRGWLRDLSGLLLRASVSSREARMLRRLLNRVSKTVATGPAPKS